MNADFESPAWARHHAALGATFDKLLHTAAVGLAALNRREFDAPWQQKAKARRAA